MRSANQSSLSSLVTLKAQWEVGGGYLRIVAVVIAALLTLAFAAFAAQKAAESVVSMAYRPHGARALHPRLQHLGATSELLRGL